MAAPTRVVVFPVAGRRWVFAAKAPVLLPGADSPQPSSMRQLWTELQRRKALGDRTELVTEYVADQMNTYWTKMGAAAPKTWYKRIHNAGMVLLSRIKPTETFLKNIPKAAQAVEIMFPPSLNAELVRKRVRLLARKGLAVHESNFFVTCAAVPVTMPLGVLPVPNFPFFWFLFRAHANWSAFRGGQRLLQLVTKSQPLAIRSGKELADTSSRSEANTHEPIEGTGGGSVQESEDASRQTQGQEATSSSRVRFPLVLTPSEELASMIAAEPSEPLSDAVLSRICEKYQLNLTEVKQWREMKVL